MAALREILARFGIQFNGRQLERGNATVETAVGGLQKLGGLLAGSFLIGSIKNFITEMADQADVLAKSSDALGLSIAQLQSWEHAAGLAGVGATALRSSIARLQKAAGDTLISSTSTAGKSFDELGVSVKNANGEFKSADDLFFETVSALGGMTDITKRNALAMQLLGRQGAKLGPLMQQGAEGIEKLRAELGELGGGFTEEFARQSEQFNDSISRMRLQFLSLRVGFLTLVLPHLESFVKGLTKGAKFVQRLTKDTNITKAALVLLGSASVVALGKILKMAGLLNKAFFKWTLLALVATLAVDELITTWEGGDTIIRRVIDGLFGEGSTQKAVDWTKEVGRNFAQMFRDMREDPVEFEKTWARTLKSIRKDLTDTFGGENSAAGIAAAAWFDVWMLYIDLATGGWENFQKKISAVAEANVTVLEAIWSGLKFAFLGFAAEISDAFDNTWNSIVRGAQSALGVLHKALKAIPGGGDLAKSVKATIKELSGVIATPDAADTIDRLRLDDAARIDAKLRDLKNVISPTANVSNTVNVTVPPGTPEATGKRIGREASRVIAGRGNATLRSSVPTG